MITTEALKFDVPETPIVQVHTTENRGFTPEEVAERCVDRLISISDTADPALREQARAFKKQANQLIAYYMRQAIRSDRTTIYNALKDAGHPKLAEAIRRL
jgi:adenylate kinase family enzyme